MSPDVPETPGRSLASLGPGSRVAGYRLEALIGEGGMAIVFLADDERLGRRVALKLLTPVRATDQGFRQRFIRESRAAAAVDDPHIIPIYEAGESDGVLFIAMRYVAGGDVRKLLYEQGLLPGIRIASIISPVASALDAAHAAGLVHRDVKPENMLMDVRPDRPDHVYLSDFGLSKGAMASTELTRSGQILGTPNYTAPEQIRGHAVDGRADQYALACAAFEMLTGEPPFGRDNWEAVLLAHLHDPPPPASSRRADLPSTVDRMFARALAKRPQDRYPTCREFAEALRTAIGVPPYRPDAVKSETARSATHAKTDTADYSRQGEGIATGTARRLTSPEANAGRHEARSPDKKHSGALLAEVIMFRVRSIELVGSLEQYGADHLASDAAVAAGIAADIARARDQASDSDLRMQLTEAENIARKLLQALRNNGYHTQRWPTVWRALVGNDTSKVRKVWAGHIAEDLRDKLLQIPLDVSGLDVRSIDLPDLLAYDLQFRGAFQAVWGVVWTDETIWPDRYRDRLMRVSQPLRKGVYQVVP